MYVCVFMARFSLLNFVLNNKYDYYDVACEYKTKRNETEGVERSYLGFFLVLRLGNHKIYGDEY